MSRGYSLIELATVMAIVAMAATSLAPGARRYRDAASVAAARESVLGLLTTARVRALGKGGVTVTILGRPWRAVLEEADSVIATVEIEADLGVELTLSRARMTTTLAFDALGLGRVSSETIRFRRASVERLLVISSYGRARRR